MSEQLKYKLLHFQQKPPEKLWAEIDAALDDQQSSLSKKLYNYKQSPPTENWNNIEKELNKLSTPKATVKPFFGKLSYKLLTAAVLIIAVSIITFLVIKDPSSTPVKNIVTTTPSNELIIPTEESSNSDVAVTPTPSSPINNNVNKPNTSSIQPADKKTAINDTRYTTVADDDGKMVRLSKKIFPVFDCAENSTAFLRKRCQENIESLQKQMASSIVSPAADFAGLLDMLKKLEENN